MADIFISYARSDRAAAQRLADALEDRGWSVWWDPQIPVGRHFEEVIEKQLALAGCVVVLWSRQSVQSRWVRSEAADGRDRDILAPVLLEDAQIPLIFRGIQTADLRAWNGDTDHAGFNNLVSAISGRLESSIRNGTASGDAKIVGQPGLAEPGGLLGFVRGLRRGSRQAHHFTKRHSTGPGGLLVGATGAAIGIAVAFQYAYPTVSVDTGLGILFALTGLIVMFVMRALWRILRGQHREQ